MAADVWLIQYDPNIVNVPIARVENAGGTLAQINVVPALKRIGQWDGSPATFGFSKASHALHSAILVQQPRGGSVLAAATD
nr:hypothetical protein [Rhizobium sp. P40RR-XXII]